MKPDYGLMLKESGLGGVEQHFYSVPLSHISLGAPGGYTSMLNKVHAGVEYAVSFDFGTEQLMDVLSKLPAAGKDRVSTLLKQAAPGFTIDFPEPVIVDLTAALGKVQSVAREQFVPLVVTRVA